MVTVFYYEEVVYPKLDRAQSEFTNHWLFHPKKKVVFYTRNNIQAAQ